MDLLFGTSYIHQCIPFVFPVEYKIGQIHSHPVDVLTSLPEVMMLLEEDVKEDKIAYESGNLKYFLCRMAY